MLRQKVSAPCKICGTVVEINSETLTEEDIKGFDAGARGSPVL